MVFRNGNLVKFGNLIRVIEVDSLRQACQALFQQDIFNADLYTPFFKR